MILNIVRHIIITGYSMYKCQWCDALISGTGRTYCSVSCKMKAFRKNHPELKEKERQRQYRNNKYVKKPGDKVDRKGDKNPNWKGGVSKENMRYRKRFTDKNPEKVKVNGRVNNKILSGKIIRGCCCICGKEKADAHHEDYSKPFEITWLCRKHHNQYHKGLIELP